jgi:cyclic beta-1,2-glucan synthetase
MQRAGIEGILGIRREGSELTVDPCIPRGWPGFEARIKAGGSDYDIRVAVSTTGRRARPKAVLDGRNLPLSKGRIRVSLDGQPHRLEIELRTGAGGG